FFCLDSNTRTPHLLSLSRSLRMKTPLRLLSAYFILAALLAAGCGQEGLLLGTEDPAAVIRQYSLPSEPVGRRGVCRVCHQDGCGEYVVVVGRVVETLAQSAGTVTLVDLTQELDSDETPCSPTEEESQSMIAVQFVDAHGQIPLYDVPYLLGVKEG